MLQPTGIRIGSLLRLLKLSQYRRAEEVAAFGSQYSMMSSNISSRASAFSGFPRQSVHAQNFSRIQAPSPAGESASPYPSVSGRLLCCFEEPQSQAREGT